MARTVLAVVLVALLAAACGSRRDEADFVDALGRPAFEGYRGGQGASAGELEGGEEGAGDTVAPEAAGGSGGGATGAGGEPATGPASGPGGGGATGAGGGPATGPASGPGGGGPNGGREANRASDVGVTETTIKVGNIVSRGGPLGPNQFTPSFYGANAFFRDLNARGGVNGRKVEFITCDDREESGQNRQCAEKLVAQKVFAFVANNSRVHFGGASYIDSNGVPDVGGQPIGYEYFKYPHLFPFYMAAFGHYPRNGKTGWDGTLYQSDAPYKWLADQGIKDVAVLYYSIPISKSEGQNQARAVERHGGNAIEFEINPALPGWDSIVARMRDANVQGILNAIDNTGNQNLCTSLDRAGYQVKIHMMTVAGWTRAVGRDYSSPCRNNLYSFGFSVAGSVRSNPEIARFHRVAEALYGKSFAGTEHQWAVEGWLAAKQFTEAVASMGANVTREGLMAWYNGLRDYDMGGLITRGSYEPFKPTDGQRVTSCFSIVRWSEAIKDYQQLQPPTSHCIQAQWFSFKPVYEP